MQFTEMRVSGAVVIDLEPRQDARGFFARMLCRKEFEGHALQSDFVQWNNSYSVSRGTLRGLHYQTTPHEEAKLVRCIGGAVFDVVADVRRGSPTFGRWFGVELSATNRRMLFVPPGCAHGYLTMVDGAEVIYGVTAPYAPTAERGVRWDDPLFNIEWPDVGALTLTDKDRHWPDTEP